MTKTDFTKEINRSRLKYENLDRKLDNILENQNTIIQQNIRELENQQIIIQQLLFVSEYMVGDDEKREEIKKNLSCLFDKSVNKKRRAI